MTTTIRSCFRRPRLRKMVPLLGLWLLFAAPALAYQQLVIFGDSLSDPGNAFALTGEQARKPYALIPDAPYARGGHHFSNGSTWIEQLAVTLHSPDAGPAFRAPAFRNYAVGGSRARPGDYFVDLSSQVSAYLASQPAATDDTLFVIFIGSNDVRDAIEAFAKDPSGATSAGILSGALTAIGDNIMALYAAGARHFLIANAPDLGQVPAVIQLGPPAQFAATQLSIQFNTALTDLLDSLESALGLDLVRLDIFAILTAIVADPAGNGLVNIDTPCIIPDETRKATCSRPDDYLFWDGIHPTRAGHALLADAAQAALAAP